MTLIYIVHNDMYVYFNQRRIFMKKISYTTTMAILLASSMLTVPAFASGSDANSPVKETVDALLDGATQRSATAVSQQTGGASNEQQGPSATNGNRQSAPTLREIAYSAAQMPVHALGAFVQGALKFARVKTYVSYNQHLSAFEIAAANRIANEKAESKDGTCESKAQNRCKTIRAYEDAIKQRNQTDIEFLLKRYPDYLKEQLKGSLKDVDTDKTIDELQERQTANQLTSNLGRGLGLLPGMHAVIKDGYHYNIFAGSVACCPPPQYDLRTDSKVTGANFPMILNQGGTMSCVAQAFSSAMNFARRAQGLPNLTPSRSFIWSWTRQIGHSGTAFDGTLHKGLGNWGCNMGIAGDLVSAQGAPSESDAGCEWYSDMAWHTGGVSNTTTRHDSDALSAAAHGDTDVASPLSFIHQSDTNTLTGNVNAIRCALYSGYPVLIAIDVRRSSYFEPVGGDFVTPFSNASVNNSIDFDHPVDTDPDGTPVYAAGDFSVGGHAILLVGYNNDAANADGTPNGRFTFMNSWGAGWGTNGYGTLPYQYVCGTASTYSAANAIQANVTQNHPTTGSITVANTMFSPAPYAGFLAQIKSCTN